MVACSGTCAVRMRRISGACIVGPGVGGLVRFTLASVYTGLTL